MSGLHAVKSLVDHVVVPGVGLVDKAQTTVNISTDNFNLIPAASFSGGKLQDLGGVSDPADAVASQAAFVAQPAALTATATAGATYTSAEQGLINALKADVTALRGTVAALLTALQGVGKPEAAS